MKIAQDLRIAIKAAADAAERKAREQLASRFGLSQSSLRANGEFGLADEAGGKISTKLPRFSEDQVIAEYAAAKTQVEAVSVLKKYNIVWT